MTPFLPGFSEEEQKREKIRRRVRPTSRAQYAVGREKYQGRKANVLRWLAAMYNRNQVWPTSGEIADYAADTTQICVMDWADILLYVRRGLSDLQDDNAVETIKDENKKDIKRRCAVVESMCCVWMVKQR